MPSSTVSFPMAAGIQSGFEGNDPLLNERGAAEAAPEKCRD